MPRSQLVENDSEREEIRSAIGWFAFNLFWREICRSPSEAAVLRDMGGKARDAEIGQHDAPVLVDHDVCRLNVAVNDALFVGISKCAGQSCPPAVGLLGLGFSGRNVLF